VGRPPLAFALAFAFALFHRSRLLTLSHMRRIRTRADPSTSTVRRMGGSCSRYGNKAAGIRVLRSLDPRGAEYGACSLRKTVVALTRALRAPAAPPRRRDTVPTPQGDDGDPTPYSLSTYPSASRTTSPSPVRS
jgi:hypothetical protein